MNESTNTTVTIDLRKARIRIFRHTIHALGDPKYIQLLVNPTNKTVAICNVDEEASNHLAHKVKMVTGDASYEIYSRSFIAKLYEIVGSLDPQSSYRLSGHIVAGKRLAVFSMDTLTRIEVKEVE